MQQRQLGNSGLKVSVVGLGCNNFGGDRIDLYRWNENPAAGLFFNDPQLIGCST